MAVPVGQSKYALRIVGDHYTRNITAATRIEFQGNWEKVGRVLENMPRDIKNITYLAILEYGKMYHREIKRAIMSNGPSAGKPWPKYSDAYAAFKRSQGSSGYPSFYRLQGLLMQAIKLETTGRGHVRVTVDKNAPVSNKNSKLNSSQLMNVLEHGSVRFNIGARPLFGPVWSSMGGNKALAKFVSTRIGRKLQSYQS